MTATSTPALAPVSAPMTLAVLAPEIETAPATATEPATEPEDASASTSASAPASVPASASASASASSPVLVPLPADQTRPDTAQALAALRGRGADPVQLRHIEALARRALQHEGAARRLLDSRVQQLLAARAPPAQRPPPAAAAPAHAEPQRDTLAALLAHIAEHNAAAWAATHAAAPPAAAPTAAAPTAGAPLAAAPAAGAPELKAVRDYRSTWSRLHMEQRLTLALAKVPANAGPLNTQRLLHQALAVMREQSPAYLQRFMVQVEALLWLEQVNHGAAPEGKRSGGKKPRQ